MLYNGRAYDIHLMRNIQGDSTLTFSLDGLISGKENGDLKENYLIKYLFNEVKIKLFYQDKWSDYIVKSIQETHNERLTFIYTCQPLAIYELSKTGYNKVFSLEKEDGSAVQDAHSFMKDILEDTEWEYVEAGTPNNIAVQDLEVNLSEKNQEILYHIAINDTFEITPFIIQNGQLIEKTSYNQLLDGIFLPYSQIDITENKVFAVIDDIQDSANFLIDENKLVLISAKDFRSFIINPTQFYINIPKKSIYSEFISYTDFDNAGNSINQYCNVFTDKTNQIEKGYYRTITFNSDYGYSKTIDPTPAKRTFAETTELLGGDLYCIYRDTENTEKLTYLKFHPDRFREGDIFDIFYLNGVYKVNQNSNTDPSLYLNAEIVEMPGTEIKMLSTANKTYFLKTISYDGMIIYTPFSNLISFTDGGHSIEDWYTCDITGDEIKDLTDSVFSIKQYFTIKRDDNQKIQQIIIEGYSSTEEIGYYKEDENGDYYFDDINGKYTKEFIEDSKKYIFCPVDEVFSYNKFRTIEAQKSNSFNLTQMVAETFEVWCRYIIEYEDNGKIKYDPITGRRKKWVTLVSNYGKENQIGFTYGLNVTAINRNVDSNSLSTKLYVEYCENASDPNGIITIQKAKDNLSKENFIINFDYFIQKGLLNGQEVSRDLYNIEVGDFDLLTGESYIEGNLVGPGYLRLLGKLNYEYDLIYDTILGTGENSLTNQYVEYKTLYDAYNIACMTDGSALSGNEEDDLEYRRELDRSMRDNYKALMDEVQNKINYYTKYINTILERKKVLHRIFNLKYSRYLQEGSWIGAGYVSNDVYYNDSLSVSADAAKPNVSYTINVINLGVIEKYKLFKYEVGDQTWIEDIAYFGYDLKNKPYHEKVVITQIDEYLDNPSQSQFTISNHSNKFNDLFNSISATINSYTLNQQTYNRASNITTSGGLKFNSLQDSFNKNKEITLIDNNVVTSDKNGITVKNASNPNDIVRIVSGGIVLSNDGGQTYITGIYAGMINTELLKAGVINTEKIQIGTTTENGSLYFSGDKITAENNYMSSEFSTQGILLKRGDSIIFNFNDKGDLTLSGNIIGGENTEEISPKYYIGVDDILHACAVGPEYIITKDRTRQPGKTYYIIESGYMSLQDIENLSSTEGYSFSTEYYTLQENYVATNDKTYNSSKTYYTKSGDNFIKFTGTEFDKETIYYEKSTPIYVKTDTIGTPTTTFKQYSLYKIYSGAFVSGTTYYERSSNELKKDWRLLIGDSPTLHNFGVDSKGQLYASQAVFSGNVYADGGVFNNVIINNTCTVAGEAINGVMGSVNDLRIKYDNILDVTSNGGQIGSGWGAITVDKNGGITVPISSQSGYAYEAGSAGSAGYAANAGNAVNAKYANEAGHATSAGNFLTIHYKNWSNVNCLAAVYGSYSTE